MVPWQWLLVTFLGGLATAWCIGFVSLKQKEREAAKWREEHADLVNVQVAIAKNGVVYFYRDGNLMTAALADEETIDLTTMKKVDFENATVEEMLQISNAIEVLSTE